MLNFVKFFLFPWIDWYDCVFFLLQTVNMVDYIDLLFIVEPGWHHEINPPWLSCNVLMYCWIQLARALLMIFGPYLWGILVCGFHLLFCPFLALYERNAGLMQQAGKCSLSFLEETVKPRRPGYFCCGRSLEGSGGGCFVGRLGWTEGSCPCGRAPTEPPIPGAAAWPLLDFSLCRSRWSFTI